MLTIPREPKLEVKLGLSTLGTWLEKFCGSPTPAKDLRKTKFQDGFNRLEMKKTWLICVTNFAASPGKLEMGSVVDVERALNLRARALKVEPGRASSLSNFSN